MSLMILNDNIHTQVDLEIIFKSLVFSYRYLICLCGKVNLKDTAADRLLSVCIMNSMSLKDFCIYYSDNLMIISISRGKSHFALNDWRSEAEQKLHRQASCYIQFIWFCMRVMAFMDLIFIPSCTCDLLLIMLQSSQSLKEHQ